MLQEFYQEQQGRISGVQSAVPQFKTQRVVRLPPPPTAELLEIINDEKKKKISNVESATPLIGPNLRGAPVPPPPPLLEDIRILY